MVCLNVDGTKHSGSCDLGHLCARTSCNHHRLCSFARLLVATPETTTKPMPTQARLRSLLYPSRLHLRIVVKENGEPVLTATFDEQNRLTNLEVRLEARADSPADAPSESWDQAQWRRLLNG